MPEATVDENRLALPNVGQIRLAWNVLPPETVSRETERSDDASDSQLDFRVGTAYRSHDFAAGLAIFGHVRLIAVMAERCCSTPFLVIVVERTVSAPS